MKNLKCKSLTEFSCIISNMLNEIRNTYYPGVSIIAKYDEMKIIIAKLICIGHPLVSVSEFNAPDFNGYNKEFILSLDSEGIWIEPMYREENHWHKAGYLTVDDEVCCILDNCNSKLLSHIHSNCVFTVEIGEDDTLADNSVCQKETGISTDMSKNFVNGKEVEKGVFDRQREDILKRFNKFDADFSNMLRDALLFQCAYLDKYNDVLKLLW